VTAIDEGALFVNYIGHAGTDHWAGENLFNNGNLASLDNGGKMPVMLPMTCNEGAFHTPWHSLGESVVRLAGKGAIASWSPTGLGVATGHDYLNRGFYDAVFNSDIEVLGGAVEAAKQNLWNHNVSRDLIDTYVLLGDPALRMPLYSPTATDLLSFTAETVPGNRVRLGWETASELDTLGFNLYRQVSGGEKLVNVELIPTQSSGASRGAVYERIDGPLPSGTHVYWLETVDIRGRATRTGLVSVSLAASHLYLPLIRSED
jgi:hypothetical protein